jgi:dTDP-4-amino-4,6-dideoxygalactose transaminase
LKKKIEKLAIMGGEPVRKKPWPIWPRADENTEKILKDVLYSGRWTISGCYTGKKSYERKFAEVFAKFHNVPYCVPTANGSAALKIALEALDVGYGKEVLVPGLTWVACASSVLAVGAIPILVDIDPDSLCMSLQAAKKSITKNTAAIMLVHLYSRIADLDGFLKLSNETGIPLIEDCSHVHGAIWKGKRVGTFGRIGVFSMQQTKVLTCGEGGATITKDKDLYEKMQQFRADGRLYRSAPLAVGQMELEEAETVLGKNFCMSEFHAAILLDRLQHLDNENRVREKNAEYLTSLLSEIDGIKPLYKSKETDMPVYYQFCIFFDTFFQSTSIEIISNVMSSELRIQVSPAYTPLNCYPFCKSLTRSGPGINSTSENDSHCLAKLTISSEIRNKSLVIPHQILLAEEDDMYDIFNALKKIKICFK